MTLKKYLASSDMEENIKEDDSGTGSNLIFTTHWGKLLNLSESQFSQLCIMKGFETLNHT